MAGGAREPAPAALAGERSQPCEERLRELGEARFPVAEGFRRAEQRIGRSFPFRKAGVNETFAHARRAESYLARADDLQEFREQRARIRQMPRPAPDDPGRGSEGGRPKPPHEAGELRDLSGRKLIGVDDVERVVGALDVQPCESAPSSPHRVEARGARPFTGPFTASLAEPLDTGEDVA